jgi:adenine-specific DNA methylase
VDESFALEMLDARGPEPLRRSVATRFTSLDANKLRGGYYTAPEIAQWLCQWAIRDARDNVLEPSCGDGVFVEGAAIRLTALGAVVPAIQRQLVGVEIVDSEAHKARARLAAIPGGVALESCVVTKDFFEWWNASPRHRFEAVIGNPPFIRYQAFPEPSREMAMRIMAAQHLTPNRLTNSWVPFVVAAACSLAPGGRLAFVLPAELLQVSYAAQLRSFLADRFARIDIVACNQLFFPGAEQEVVLFLADGAQSPSVANVCRVTFSHAHTIAEITSEEPYALTDRAPVKSLRHDSEKWLKYFLTEREIGLMRCLREAGEVSQLSAHAEVDVGVVTGKNEFFVVSSDQIAEHELADFVIPLVARAAHLSGAALTVSDWRHLAERGERVHLFHLNGRANHPLPPALEGYLRMGERQGIHKGYKCSIRSPWYAVPSVWTPDAFFFRQIYDFPRVVLNRASATATDTIHRMTCRHSPDQVAANIYTHLTAASAEIEGRSYGGGVLELEPTEVERLLMPRRLSAALPIEECDRLVRAGALERVLEENDRLVLQQGIGLDPADCAMLKGIWQKMRDRRISRRRARAQPKQRKEVGGD